MKKIDMTAIFFGAIFVFVVLVGNAQATPASGFSGATIVSGDFEDIDVNITIAANNLDGVFSPPAEPFFPWHSSQKTNGPSRLFVQSNTWSPNGTTGWHTHPGHSFIIVTSGRITVYEGDDPTCTPHEYTAGMTLIDRGGDHAHVIRNEPPQDPNEPHGPATGYAVQLVPAGANRRIDAEANPACGF